MCTKKNPGSGLDRCTTDSALWLRIEKSPYYDFVHFQTKLASTPPSLFKPITFGNYLRTYDMVSYMKWIDVTPKKEKEKKRKRKCQSCHFISDVGSIQQFLERSLRMIYFLECMQEIFVNWILHVNTLFLHFFFAKTFEGKTGWFGLQKLSKVAIWQSNELGKKFIKIDEMLFDSEKILLARVFDVLECTCTIWF